MNVDPTLPLDGVPRRRASKVPRTVFTPAAELPVAAVRVDTGVFHLDRPFDYAVSEEMSVAAQPGVRVKVPFAGREVDGFVIDRVNASDHDGSLTPLKRVVSAEVVLTSEVARLIDALAVRYAGAHWDLFRLAVPPRHATTEAEVAAPVGTFTGAADAVARGWGGYVHGEAFVGRIAAGGAPRAIWHAAPGADWPVSLAAAVGAALASGRGAVVCLPDATDVARCAAALDALIGPQAYATLLADVGPAARYREFLRLTRGDVKVAIGTRAAAFAPVRDLGLVAVWDDGADTYDEPRAPYPHAREVLRMRAEQQDAAMIVGGFAPSVESEQWVAEGWAHPVVPGREAARAALTVRISGATDRDLERDPTARVARIPREAYEVIRTGLETGPVLVHTPRRGYAATLACGTCRTPARCAACHGPLQVPAAGESAACGWCGTVADPWRCSECGGATLRAGVVGEARTAEELGRTFPGIRIVSSSGAKRVLEVGSKPQIVVATPGAEPVAEGGYSAVVLLDTWLARSQEGMRVDEEAVRRWSNALGFAGPGANAVVVGDPADAALQALVRWDQPGFARREAAQRAEAHLPPAASVVTVSGDAGAVDDFLTLAAWPSAVEVLGPVDLGDEWRAVVRAPRSLRAELVAALTEVMRVRSARKLEAVKVRVDPVDL